MKKVMTITMVIILAGCFLIMAKMNHTDVEIETETTKPSQPAQEVLHERATEVETVEVETETVIEVMEDVYEETTTWDSDWDNSYDDTYFEEEAEMYESALVCEISPGEFEGLGEIYWNGWRWTWYSENVLPGDGLDILGRWSDGNFVRDCDGYICVASSDLDYETVIETPFGAGKVYDCGCSNGTIDMYVSW